MLSETELKQGFEQLSNLRKTEYGDDLEWALQDFYFDDEELWRIARLTGVIIKSDYSDKKSINSSDRNLTKTGANFSYIINEDKIKSVDFENSWQFQIYEAMRHPSDKEKRGVVLGRASASENALWLASERKTVTYVVRMIHPLICSSESEVGGIIDDLCSEGINLTTQIAPSLALAQWLVDNFSFLATAPPMLIASIVVIIGRMGKRRFCMWGKQLTANDDKGTRAESQSP